jgi:tetratricopeptide (TPR) repeat protein
LTQNDATGPFAVGTGIAQAYGPNATASVTIQGITSEQLQAALRAAGQAQQAVIDNLSQQLSTTQESVRGFLEILRHKDVPLERLSQTLAEIAQRYLSMLERLSALAPEGAASRAKVDQARLLLTRADSTNVYDEADALLAEAEASDIQAIQQAEALEKEAQEGIRRKRHNASAIRSERGDLSLTRLDYLQAADHFRTAANLLGSDASELHVDYLSRYALALHLHGDERGDNAVLKQATDVYREVLNECTRDQMPQRWALTQNNLGAALATLGKRERGTTRLEEALVACYEALKEWTRERVPLQWAMAQNNLGNALSTLGGREGGTVRLEEALATYREVLKEWTRERVPLDWAITQNNLGTALATLGNRESGTTRLEEAVTAFREALQEYTRERSPRQWAMTQSNLGTALTTLGERESRTTRLEEAVTAFREALQEYTRERAPLDWAATQSNLGNVLQEWDNARVGRSVWRGRSQRIARH